MPLSKDRAASLPRRLIRLCVVMASLIVIIWVLAPLPLEHIAPFNEYGRVVNETGINPGALYYTDVPQSSEGEMHNRDALRYFTK